MNGVLSVNVCTSGTSAKPRTTNCGRERTRTVRTAHTATIKPLDVCNLKPVLKSVKSCMVACRFIMLPPLLSGHLF